MLGLTKRQRIKLKNQANAQKFRVLEKLKFKNLGEKIKSIVSELEQMQDDPEIIKSTIEKLFSKDK